MSERGIRNRERRNKEDRGGGDTDISTPAKKTLDRIRSSRRQAGGDGAESMETTPSDPAKTTSKRLEALRLKNSTRNKLTTSLDENAGGDQEKLLNEMIEEKEIGGPLVGITHPIHLFPIQILPTSRQMESVAQPLLYTPYPSPTSPLSCSLDKFTLQQTTIKKEGTWEIEQVDHSQAHSKTIAEEAVPKGETGQRNRRLRKGGEGERKGNKDDEEEEEEPLLAESDPAESDPLLPPSVQTPGVEIMSPSRKSEGLYPGEGPIVTELLLRSEPVDLPVSAIVSGGIYLSRSTQRLLRDALSQYSAHTLRQLWETIQSTSQQSEDLLPSQLASALEKTQKPASLRNPFLDTKNHTTAENWQAVLQFCESCLGSSSRRSGLSVLLRSEENSDPTMRLLENWIDQRTQQQTHPATTKKTFFDNDSPNQSLVKSSVRGHIFDGMGGTAAQERKGVTLKILAHEVSLSDHPYMSEEEVAYVALKRIYSQYSKHLRSKAYEYLPYRLLSLIAELRSLTHPLATALQDLSPKEFETLVDRLYCDLLETLPVLCEYKATLEDLENNLYSSWRKLIDLRRRQGFVSTRGFLIAKNLQYSASDSSISQPSSRERSRRRDGTRKSDQERDQEKRDRNEEEQEEEGGHHPFQVNSVANQYWKELLTELNPLPELMRSAFEKSHPSAGLATDLSSSSALMNTSNAHLLTPSSLSGAQTPLKKSHSSLPPPSSIAKKAQSEKPIQHAKAIEMIESAVEYLTPPSNRDAPTPQSQSILSSVIYRLSNTGPITPDENVPLEEINRRNKLKRVRIRIVLKVHGQIVATSSNHQLQWPELKVTIDQLYELRVLRQAANVVFDIFASYELKSHSILSCCSSLLVHEMLVATVGVPLSQQQQRQGNDFTAPSPALCYSPSIAWYEFTSQSLMDASHGRGLVYVNNKLTSNLSTIRLAGALLCGSEYDIAYDPVTNSITSNSNTPIEGVPWTDVAFIPASDPSGGGGMVGVGSGVGGIGSGGAGAGNRRVIGGKLDFTKEKDFFDLLPSLHLLDTHDPKNDLIVQHQIQGMISGRLRKRNIFQFGGEYFSWIHREAEGGGDGGGVSYGNYFKYQLSYRLQLLRLRELKPYLFTESIPLSEELIRSSELFKKILQTEAKKSSSGGSTHYLVDYLKDPQQQQQGQGQDLNETLPGGVGVGYDTEEEEDGISNLMATDLHSRQLLKSNTFLSRVRDTQIVLSRQARKKKIVTSSVVHEVLEPLNEWNFFSLFGSFGLPKRKRALKPKPIDRTPEALPKKCDLMIQIVSARNVPLRVDVTGETGKPSRNSSGKKKSSGFGSGNSGRGSRSGLSDEQSGFLEDDLEGGDDDILQDKKRVRPFVEVTFQENKVRTTSMEGPAPVWKQSVSLPFNPPHGEFNHSTLEQVTDMLTFTLFDEYVFDDAARGGFLDGENTQREERFYLGSFSIPFSTILEQKRIEGTFRLDTPSFNYGYVNPGFHQRKLTRREPESAPGGLLGLFGYRASSNRSAGGEGTASTATGGNLPDNLVKEFELSCTTPTATTYLTVMVTLDPLLVTSPYVDSDVTISTTFPPDRPLVTYAQLWLQTIRDLGNHTRKRRYMLFGSNSDGLSVLLCRYLKPLQPPPGVVSRRACIHLVSLLPFIPDSQAFVGEFDLWCTATQTWQIMGGDEEEHATILFNYLYYLSLKARGEVAAAGGAAGGGEKKKSSSSGERDRFYLGYPSEEFIRNEELFLVIGEAIPEGNTVYILMRATPATAGSRQSSAIQVPATNSRSSPSLIDNTPKGWVLINPVTGHIYSAADPHCPLHEISCLVTPYNIWTNIQKASKPKDLMFDIFQLAHWRPLFGQRFRPNIPGLTPIQSEVLYEPTSPALCFEIEKILKNEIKSHLRKWRNKKAKSVTFHPEVSSTMTDMLTYLEEWKMHGTVDGAAAAGEGDDGSPAPSHNDGGGVRHSNLSASRVRMSGGASGGAGMPYHILRIIEDKATSRLKNILHSNVLHGYPINTPYTDVNAILTKIHLCGLHETKHPDVLFVLSVRCFPLFNGLFSVWLFLGTLEKERS